MSPNQNGNVKNVLVYFCQYNLLFEYVSCLCILPVFYYSVNNSLQRPLGINVHFGVNDHLEQMSSFVRVKLENFPRKVWKFPHPQLLLILPYSHVLFTVDHFYVLLKTFMRKYEITGDHTTVMCATNRLQFLV